MQPEFGVERAQFCRCDQLPMSDSDLEQFSIEVLLPKIQEFVELGEAREEVVLLPEIALQHGWIIGHSI